jgi:hypothetical protein
MKLAMEKSLVMACKSAMVKTCRLEPASDSDRSSGDTIPLSSEKDIRLCSLLPDDDAVAATFFFFFFQLSPAAWEEDVKHPNSAAHAGLAMRLCLCVCFTAHTPADLAGHVEVYIRAVMRWLLVVACRVG